MATDPQPPREAALITQRIAAMVPQPSRSQLARDAGISPALWAKIEKGYDQPAPGLKVPYKGSAKAVAAMCAVTGVTAAELRKAKRPDAAAILEATPAIEEEPSEVTAAGWQAMLDRLARMEAKLDDVLGPAGPKGTGRRDNGGEGNGTRRAG